MAKFSVIKLERGSFTSIYVIRNRIIDDMASKCLRIANNFFLDGYVRNRMKEHAARRVLKWLKGMKPHRALSINKHDPEQEIKKAQLFDQMIEEIEVTSFYRLGILLSGEGLKEAKALRAEQRKQEKALKSEQARQHRQQLRERIRAYLWQKMTMEEEE